MFDITCHNNLPDNLRHAGHYPYLNNELRPYWLHAIDVSHNLLETHRKANGNRTYYQDQFSADFIIGLQDTWIPGSAGIAGCFELNNSLRGDEQKSDPAWIEYRKAVVALKCSPRGMQILVHKVMPGYSAWEARIHAGGGYISDCNTMERFKDKPPATAAMNCLLSYEAYLARKQAETEQRYLANYAQIRDLKLQPGTLLKEVDIFHNGKTRKFSFKIAEIYPTGSVRLVGGKLRGSANTFESTVEALSIEASHLQEYKPVIKPVVDEATASLF